MIIIFRLPESRGPQPSKQNGKKQLTLFSVQTNYFEVYVIFFALFLCDKQRDRCVCTACCAHWRESSPPLFFLRNQVITTPPTRQCEGTGRRHRVSPCRSAYFASPHWLLTLYPWRRSASPQWLLTLDLWRRRREAALLCPESWWHLTMRLSPISFYDNPEYKMPS